MAFTSESLIPLAARRIWSRVESSVTVSRRYSKSSRMGRSTYGGGKKNEVHGVEYDQYTSRGNRKSSLPVELGFRAHMK